MTLPVFKEKILSALIQIRDEGPIKKDVGLCSNLDSILFPNISKYGQMTDVVKTGTWLEETFKLWSKYSDEEAYPVPSPNETKTAKQAYWTCNEIYWEGEYGQLRYELLDFLISVLVEEDRNTLIS